jgi:hypothetical protein
MNNRRLLQAVTTGISPSPVITGALAMLVVRDPLYAPSACLQAARRLKGGEQ